MDRARVGKRGGAAIVAIACGQQRVEQLEILGFLLLAQLDIGGSLLLGRGGFGVLAALRKPVLVDLGRLWRWCRLGQLRRLGWGKPGADPETGIKVAMLRPDLPAEQREEALRIGRIGFASAGARRKAA
jgi:hypothetical protein